MLWNLTYADSDRWAEVYAIAGKPRPWWKRSGSPRLRLLDGSPEVRSLVDETSDVKWANLQRTQSGAILYFRVRLEVYGVPWTRKEIQVEWAERDNDGTLKLRSADQNVTLAFSAGQHKAVQAFVHDAFGPS